MSITYKLNGETIRPSKAHAIIIDTWAGLKLTSASDYFFLSQAIGLEGVLARTVIQANCIGLTIHCDAG